MKKLVGTLALLGMLCALLGCGESPKTHGPMVQGVYVWQQAWSPAVVEAVRQAAPVTHAIMVLAATLELEDAGLQPRYAGLDAEALAGSGRPVWLVVRAHVLPGLGEDPGRAAAVEAICAATAQVLQTAETGGLGVAGVQLDYDCATSGLAEYAQLLEAVQARLQGVALSITTLPDWLDKPGLTEALAPVEHFVLQVHSLERPARVDDPLTLCDPTRVPGWVEAAGKYRRPFYVALPTYGYRLYYGADGAYIGTVAEGRHVLRGQDTREVHADPEAMAALVRGLQAERPASCQGVVWFRLPVAGDEMNWPWPVLAEVMQGRSKPARVHGELRRPSAGLYEVWLRTETPYATGGRVRVVVEGAGSDLLAADVVNGFTLTEEAGHFVLLGPVPPPESPRMAAWFRMREAEGVAAALTTGKVEVLR